MKEAFDHENWNELEQMAHSLKGSAANIGAESLHEAAKSLEGACADEALHPPEPKILEDLEKAMNQVLESIGTLLGDSKKSGEMPGADSAQALPALEKLAEALELSDPQKIVQYLETVRKDLGPGSWQLLEESISSYKYDEALDALRQIENKLRSQSGSKEQLRKSTGLNEGQNPASTANGKKSSKEPRS